MNPRARIFLTIGITGLATAIGGWFAFQKAWNYVLDGPAEVKTADLAKIASADELPTPFIKFTADQLVPTQAHLVKENTQTVIGQIYLVRVGDRWMIALLNPKMTGKVIEGEVRPVRRNWTEQINQIQLETAKTHGDKLMPFDFFGYDDWRKDWKIGLYFLIACGSIGAIFLLLGLGALGSAPQEPEQPPGPPPGTGLRTFNLPRS